MISHCARPTRGVRDRALREHRRSTGLVPLFSEARHVGCLPHPPPTSLRPRGRSRRVECQSLQSCFHVQSIRVWEPFQARRPEQSVQPLRQSLQQSIGDESVRHRCASAPCSSVWFLWSLWFLWLICRSGQQDRPNRPDKRDRPVSALRSHRTRSRIPTAPGIPTAPAVPRIPMAADCELKGANPAAKPLQVISGSITFSPGCAAVQAG